MHISQSNSEVVRCQSCAIRHRAVCGALSEDELATINAIARQRFYQAGEPILNADEEITFFANIVAGSVKLTKIMADGRQQIVGLQFAPDFLGRAFRDRSPYFAEAATDVELCVFPKKEFESLLGTKPGFEMRLFQDTLNELDAARDWMLLLGRKTATEKVASFMEMIARRSPMIGCAHSDEQVSVQFNLPLSRADIADYLGLTIETVSRQIGKLKSSGVLQLDSTRDITVRDMNGLHAAAGTEADRG